MNSDRLMVLMILLMVVVCGMTASAITALKPIHFIVTFPFSNITFALFTFPIIDGICEVYGKRIAYLTSVLGVISQALFVAFIELSVIIPGALIWQDQAHYKMILSRSYLVIIGTAVAFLAAQFLDVSVFPHLK